MKTISILFLRIIALSAVAASSAMVALYFDWSLWYAPAIFFATLAGWLLYRFARRALRTARDRGQLARLTASEHLPVNRDTPEKRLAARWKSFVDSLKRIAPQLRGQPINVLPWYVMIGRQGAGKTTALARARVASPLRLVCHDAPPEPTADCDWWCFDDAIVLDLAGRYVEPDATDADLREWSAILDQLGHYRAREGLNGVVVAIDVQRLIDANHDALTLDGCVVRERLEQLIRLFDRCFPVYILVTKCDQIYGFDDWATQLAPAARNRAFGYHGDHDVNEFIAHAFDSIHTRLSALCTTLTAHGDLPPPRALLLPNELARLRPSLDVFVRAAFGPNVYQETPYLRGLLFASGRQMGGAHSLTLPDWLDATPRRNTDDAGLFLHDIFACVLPRDRHASRPVERASRWRLTTRRLGLTAWLMACVTAGLLMTASFVSNVQTVDLIRRTYPTHLRFTGEPERDAAALSKISHVVALVERHRSSWFMRWMSVTPVDKLETDLKRRYVARYRQTIEPVSDRLLYGQSDNARDRNASDSAIAADTAPRTAARIVNLVRYVNLVQAHLRGADREELNRMPAPTIVDMPGRTDDLSPLLAELIVSYIAWSAPGDDALAKRVAAAQAKLEDLAYDDRNWSWLLDMPDTERPPDVTLADFWSTGAAREAPLALREVRVPVALTAAHRPTIDAFLIEMAQAVANRPKFLSHRSAFDTWYRTQRIDAWRDFIARFPQGEQFLTTETQWRAVIDRIPGRRDPFSSLLTRVEREFETECDDALPPWLSFVRETSRMLMSVQGQSSDKGISAVLGSITRSGGKALRETLGGAPRQGQLTIKRDAALRTELAAYNRDVAGLANDSLAGPGSAYRLAVDFHGFGVDPSIESSAMHAAFDALSGVKRLASDQGIGGDAIWSVVGGPLHTVFRYIEQQAACALQSNWERDVLWPLKRASTGDEASNQLYGAQGAIWAFVDGPAKPFVRLGGMRASTVETLGYRLPFTDAFLPMLDDAITKRVAQQRRDAEQQARQQTVAELDERIASLSKQLDALDTQIVHIGIVAQPTGVNPDAQAKPFETVLTLQCAPLARTLTNYNFRVSEQIAWRRDQCGDATLQIKLDGVTLVRRYRGQLGIAHFVQDFRYGVRHFTPRDFPEAEARLADLGVRYVDVRYDFTGQDALLELAGRIEELEKMRRDETAQKQQLAIRPSSKACSAAAPEVSTVLPRRIGACWNSPVHTDSNSSISR
ncbi:type VI secretion system protein ImpL [Burkholderia cepacia]|uniref:Type VI secretion system protein ImpL n=1 Tax=Burkholderia cepacia TaxID=292 RepID=A0A0J5WV83_BURCE|nr:type VI secretion protein IcmF/TssM N-terminal domain-containing protein [Burkholderia cepacia]KML54617.1 type VI secretion system protein ImpL [Burkholderia cepacia]